MSNSDSKILALFGSVSSAEFLISKIVFIDSLLDIVFNINLNILLEVLDRYTECQGYNGEDLCSLKRIVWMKISRMHWYAL